MKRLSFLMVLLLLVGASSAVAQKVQYDYDKDKDFSKYKTYKWVEIKGADAADELTRRQITAALDAELAKKGLTKTDSDNADLYIGYQTAIGTEKQFTTYNTGWGLWTRLGPALVWLRRNGLEHDLRFNFNDLYRSTGFEHVR